MDISAIIKAVLAPSEEPTSRALIELRPGDQLVGKILRVEKDGRALIDLGGRRALAHFGFPVKSGQLLKLHVVKTGEILHLRADTFQGDGRAGVTLPRTDFSKAIKVKDQGEFVRIAERLLEGSHRFAKVDSMPKPIQNALTQIKRVFETVPMERSPKQVSQWLKTAVEDRGVLFEKKLADVMSGAAPPSQGHSDESERRVPAERILITRDVKSQLIQLKRYLSETGAREAIIERLNSKELSFLQRSVDRMLGHIEHQQERAVARWSEGENQQVFVHTLPLRDQNNPVRLKLYYPKKDNQKGGRQHRIALLLKMDQLGDVRVDLSMVDMQLQIGFFVGNPTIQQTMERHVKEVDEALAGQFETIRINVSVSKERILQFDQEDLKGADVSRININV